MLNQNNSCPIFLLLLMLWEKVYWSIKASQLPVCVENVNLERCHLRHRCCHSVSTDCVDWWAHYCRAPCSMSICSRTRAHSVIGCHLIVCISGNKYICKTNKQKYLPPDNFLMIRKEAGLLHAADKLVKCRWRWSARFLWDRRLPEVLTWGSTLRAGDWCIHSKQGAKKSSCSFFTWFVDAAVVEGCGHRQSWNNK